jgi:hypothetical protein
MAFSAGRRDFTASYTLQLMYTSIFGQFDAGHTLAYVETHFVWVAWSWAAMAIYMSLLEAYLRMLEAVYG